MKNCYHQQPDRIRKLYYTIGELAERLNVEASYVRMICKEFNLQVPIIGRGRSFTHKDLVAVTNVYFLLHLRGFTIKGAKREIAINGWLPESELNHLSDFYKVFILEKENGMGSARIASM